MPGGDRTGPRLMGPMTGRGTGYCAGHAIGESPALESPPLELDGLAITVVTDNYYDALRPDTDVATRYRTTPGASLHAEHGLSFFAESVAAGDKSAFMFDYGVDGIGTLNNMRLLDIEFGRLNALALSHGHFDHWGGLVTILKHNARFMHKVLPLYVGKEAFAHRFTMHLPGVLTDIGKLDRRELERIETVKIVEIDRQIEVVPCRLIGLSRHTARASRQHAVSDRRCPKSLSSIQRERSTPSEYKHSSSSDAIHRTNAPASRDSNSFALPAFSVLPVLKITTLCILRIPPLLDEARQKSIYG